MLATVAGKVRVVEEHLIRLPGKPSSEHQDFAV
jgi:hypothetical protein